jgi:signal peptidase I
MRFWQLGKRRIAGRLLDAALVVLIGVGLGAAILLQLATLSGRTVVIIAGGSMSPAIPIGSLAMIESVSPDHPIQIGEVVTIRLDAAHAVVSHRVVRIADRAGGAWLELRGDANADSDQVLVPASAVVGRIVMVWPELGRWLGAFATRAGFLAVVGLAGTLYALSLLAARMDGTRLQPRSAPIGPSARPVS